MKETNQYIIPINGLSDGSHEYTFQAGNNFFAGYEGSEITGGDIKIDIILKKTGKLITLDMTLQGSAKLPCDRCLDEMNVEIGIEEKLIVEYGEQEIGEDNIIFVTENSDHIDLKQHIYEYSVLGLPYQRVHENNDLTNSSCDPEMLEKIEELSPAESADEYIDPRWNELKKIKNGTS